MYVWVFQGNLGDGKTFGMSIMANYYRYRSQRSGINTDLFSNYELQQSKSLQHYTDFYNVAKCSNSICMLDEAHTSLDSRLFQKGSNIYMTQFFFYLRKLRSTLFLSTPNISFLDSRIRVLCNILVDCQKVAGGFVYRFWDYHAGKLLRVKYISRDKAEDLFKCRMYDTNQMITAIEFPGNEKLFKSFLEKMIQTNEGWRNAQDGKCAQDNILESGNVNSESGKDIAEIPKAKRGRARKKIE